MNRLLGRMARATTGRAAARARAQRSGVALSGPASSIVGALLASGPVRLGALARAVDLELPLVSRETRELCEAGIVERHPDPADGRASIIGLSPAGEEVARRHRDAIDRMTVEAFAGWSVADIRTLRSLLERALVATDVMTGSGAPNVAAHDIRSA